MRNAKPFGYPIPHSPFRIQKADVAQLAERVLGKDEVTGSIPVIGSSLRSLPRATAGKPGGGLSAEAAGEGGRLSRRSAKREGRHTASIEG